MSVPTAVLAVPAAAETPPAPRIFAVNELVRAVRLTLESRFGEVRVEGEISGFKRSGPGHLYFCLKDDQAALDCVMYGREAARLRFQVQDGMAVRLRGRLTIYEGRGRFQMSVLEIEPKGAGALAVAFEQLKQKLQAAGLFAAARKRPLPFLPRRLGIVTSPQGAVLQDIIRIAHRRFPVPILLSPTPVQGPGAVAGIVAALERLGRVPDVDVIILARGGGSMEDLWSFNEEAVAQAIAACPVPVISAVGHETDFTIADFVADLRAPTPSAAAELAVPVMSDLRAEIMLLAQRAARGTGAQLRQARLVLERARARIGDPRRLCDERRQILDDLGTRATRFLGRRISRHRADLGAAELALSRAHPHRRIATQRVLLAELRQRLSLSARHALQRRRGPFDSFGHKLDALSPRRVLERGYSLAFAADGRLLTDAAAARQGDRIRVALRRGEVAAIVETSGESRDSASTEDAGDSEQTARNPDAVEGSSS
ncbi:MAG: exodeoxyribonuclease VII large subunit [Deltaproteobacteria bacterium]|nr:exodeoxyribonuclease VII large subunit [Deltaproteobacteria bacterium]